MSLHKGVKLTRESLKKWWKMGSKALESMTTSYEWCCFEWFKQQQQQQPPIAMKQASKASKKSMKVPKDVPKGHMVVYVGDNVRRFVVKVSLLKHPLFVALLDMARDDHDDSTTPMKLWIPCDEHFFIHVLRCATSS